MIGVQASRRLFSMFVRVDVCKEILGGELVHIINKGAKSAGTELIEHFVRMQFLNGAV